MTFRRASGGILEFSRDSESVLRSHRQLKDADFEAGGILLGRLINSAADVVVDRATSPSPADRRSRFAFFRARRPAQAAVDQAWTESGQVINYVGEWHTHPEDHPTPSCIDRRDWRKIVSRAHFEQDALFFVIVGRVSTKVWEVSKSQPTPLQLTLEDPVEDNGRRHP